MRKVKQGAAKNVMLLLVDAADHVTGKTGLTLTIAASKDGAAFAAITPTVTELGAGWYAIALTAGHTDTLGDLALHVTATGADPADLVLLVEAGATDADVSTRLATAGYTAPNNAGIASILAAVDTEVAAILAAVDTEVTAIKARTDNLPADTAATLTTVLGYVDELESRLTATRAGLLDNLDAAVSSRLATAGYTAPDNTVIAAIFAAVDTEIAAIKAKTDALPASPAATGDIPTAIQIADAVLKRDWTAVTGEADRSALNALRALRNKWSTSATTLVVTKEDDITAAWSAALTTDAGAVPVIGSDPA